jgi:hypothetical protein
MALANYLNNKKTKVVNMKKVLFVLIALLLVPVIYGMRQCNLIQEPSVNCEITTPVITCNTYDWYNSTHELATDDGAMTQIGTTGVYYFTFNAPDSGTHTILLCDNTTGTLEVASYSLKNTSESLLDGVTLEDDAITSGKIAANAIGSSEIAADAVGASEAGFLLDSTGFNGAEISAISTGIGTNRSALETYGDSNWATATGFATNSQANQILSGTQTNRTYLEDNLSTIRARGDSAWITASGFSTSAQANSILSGIQTNISYLESNLSTIRARGDSTWITATGFATSTQALSILAGIQDNTTFIDTAISALNDITAADVWTYAARTVINGTGYIAYFQSLANITTADLDSACISELELNVSHSTGNYSAIDGSTTASISSADKADIANQTFNKFLTNVTAVFHNNSLGYPTYEIWTYPNWIVNKSYGYSGYTIINQSNKRVP